MQKEAEAMKDEMYDQRTVSFTQFFCKRGIEAMNASRKDKTVIDITKKERYPI